MGVMFGEAKIASGQTVSGAVDLGGHVACAIITPAALTSTTMTFQGSIDTPDYTNDGAAADPTFNSLVDTAGAAISVTVAASRHIQLDPKVFAGIRLLKLVGGTAEGADRTIKVALRPVS